MIMWEILLFFFEFHTIYIRAYVQESVGNQVISHFYDNNNVFTIIFREGSGSVLYPWQ